MIATFQSLFLFVLIPSMLDCYLKLNYGVSWVGSIDSFNWLGYGHNLYGGDILPL